MIDEKSIEDMYSIVNRYKTMKTLNGHEINEMLKDLSAYLFYLGTVRVQVHNLWQTKVKTLVDSGSSVSRAENEAHVEYPEMYKLRTYMRYASGVSDAMRSNLSYLKQEMQNL